MEAAASDGPEEEQSANHLEELVAVATQPNDVSDVFALLEELAEGQARLAEQCQNLVDMATVTGSREGDGDTVS